MLSPSSLVMASGGARGITAACVLALARRYGCRFVLLGRSRQLPEPAWASGCHDDAELKQRISDHLQSSGAKPTPLAIQRELAALMAARDIERTVSAVSAAGSQVEYVPLDVTDAALVQAAVTDVSRRLGPISGLIHGAGALSDKPIERKTERDFDVVYATKVAGLENLLAWLPDQDLRLVILFSSAAGFFGNPGQSDYALSNEILNRVALRLKKAAPSRRVVSLNWGPWDSGMVTPELKRLFAQRGVDVIPAERGTDALIRVLDAGQPPLIGLVGGRLAQPATQPTTANRTRRVERHLDLSANPFLADHTLGGRAVLPAMCAVSWIANTGEQLYPGLRFFSLENFQVLKGIVFDDSLADSYTIECSERDADDDRLRLDVVISSAAGERARYHYRAVLTLVRREPEPPPAGVDLTENDRAVEGELLYRDGTLFHGPAFQGVERLLNASESGLTVRCRLPLLPEAQQGQFPVQTFNPFAADACFQALLIWARLFRNAASLPLGAELGEQFRTLPFDQPFYVTIKVQSVTDTRLVAETIAHDERGRVYARVSGASVTLSASLNPLFVRSTT